MAYGPGQSGIGPLLQAYLAIQGHRDQRRDRRREQEYQQQVLGLKKRELEMGQTDAQLDFAQKEYERISNALTAGDLTPEQAEALEAQRQGIGRFIDSKRGFDLFGGGQEQAPAAPAAPAGSPAIPGEDPFGFNAIVNQAIPPAPSPTQQMAQVLGQAGSPWARLRPSQRQKQEESKANIAHTQAQTGKTVADTKIADFNLGLMNEQRPALVEKPRLDNLHTQAQTAASQATAAKTRNDTTEAEKTFPFRMNVLQNDAGLTTEKLREAITRNQYLPDELETANELRRQQARQAGGTADFLGQTAGARARIYDATGKKIAAEAAQVAPNAQSERALKASQAALNNINAEFRRNELKRVKELHPHTLAKLQAEVAKVAANPDLPDGFKAELDSAHEELRAAVRQTTAGIVIDEESKQVALARIDRLTQQLPFVAAGQRFGLPYEETQALLEVFSLKLPADQPKAHSRGLAEIIQSYAGEPEGLAAWDKRIRNLYSIWRRMHTAKDATPTHRR